MQLLLLMNVIRKIIYLNQVMHTDNEQIYYNNKSLFERFPKYTLNFDEKIGITKIILRVNLDHIKIGNPHITVNKYRWNSIVKLNNQLITKEFCGGGCCCEHFFYIIWRVFW